MNQRTASIVTAVIVSCCLGARGAAQYVPGFVWDSGVDWVPGTVQGSTVNNPGPDQAGSPVWKYDYVSGGGLIGSATPWYTKPPITMVWDTSWFTSGSGCWVKGDNTAPHSVNGQIVHGVQSNWGTGYPMLRWLNPLSEAAVLNLSGSVQVDWNNSPPTNIDVVVLVLEGDGSVAQILHQGTYAKPSNDSSYEKVTVPMSLSCLPVLPGQAIAFTHRAHVTSGPGWYTFNTAGIKIKLGASSDADLNCDSAVDGGDVGALLGAWATSDPAADLNADGVVDGADLGIMLGVWTG